MLQLYRLVASCCICLMLFLSSIQDEDASASASWTFEHQTCSSTSFFNNFESPSSSSKFTYQCQDSDYMKYIQEELLSGAATGYKKDVFEAVVGMYKEKEQKTRPVRLENFDLKGNVLLMHPIGFSIPDNFILTTIPAKDKVLSRVIPGKKSTYFTVLEEPIYRQDMSKSLFSWTYKKAGWDCMRHYEILASGALPLFVDIDNSTAKSSLLLHPRRLYSLILQYPGLTYEAEKIDPMTYKFDQINMNMDGFDKKLYMTVTAAMLQYTKNIFSTKSMAYHFLKVIRISNLNKFQSKRTGTPTDSFLESRWNVPKSILYLTHKYELYEGDIPIEGDYMIDSLLHGLKTLLGGDVVTDFPRRTAIYKTHHLFNESEEYFPSKMKLYGGGFSYGHLLDDWTLNAAEESSFNLTLKKISDKITRKEYDLIVLASGHMGIWPQKLYLWDTICKFYNRQQVAWIHGGDDTLFGSEKGFPSVDMFLETYFPCAGHYFSREGLDPSIWDSFELLRDIKRRSPVVEGKVFQEVGTKALHVIQNWKARLIPDFDTFASYMKNATTIKEELWSDSIFKVPAFIFRNIPIGLNLPSIRPQGKVIYRGKRPAGSKNSNSKLSLDVKERFRRPQTLSSSRFGRAP